MTGAGGGPAAGRGPSDAGSARWPAVSAIVPVRNDAAHLPSTLEGLLRQDYPGPLEVVIAVAPSGDGSEEVARRGAAGEPRVRVVANPEGSTAAGLNRAVAASTGEIVARVDARAVPEPGYLRRAVELLAETGAEVVGGVQHAVGQTPFERAAAKAMTSRLGAGDARFRYGGPPGPVDTVYLGVFRRAMLDRLGGFDETLLCNQDYELNWRVRSAGGTVWFSPELRVRYRPRGSLRALAAQYFAYGRWKREMLRRHPRSVRWRQVVPPAVLLGNAVGCALAGRTQGRSLLVPLGYAGVVAGVSVARGGDVGPGRLSAVYVTMHTAWGMGFLMGPPSRSVCS